MRKISTNGGISNIYFIHNVSIWGIQSVIQSVKIFEIKNFVDSEVILLNFHFRNLEWAWIKNFKFITLKTDLQKNLQFC